MRRSATTAPGSGTSLNALLLIGSIRSLAWTVGALLIHLAGNINHFRVAGQAHDQRLTLHRNR
jgi:hypothetical protein